MAPSPDNVSETIQAFFAKLEAERLLPDETRERLQSLASEGRLTEEAAIETLLREMEEGHNADGQEDPGQGATGNS